MRVVFLALGFSAGLALAPFANEAGSEIGNVMFAPGATAVAMPVCTPVAVTIYFEHGQSALNTAAQSTIGAVSERVRGCAIASIAIENQPATVASEAGRRLAGLRGAGVLKSLSARGLAPETILIAEANVDEPAGVSTPDHVRISVIPASGATSAKATEQKLPDNEI